MILKSSPGGVSPEFEHHYFFPFSMKLYTHCLVLIGSKNWSERDLRKN